MANLKGIIDSIRKIMWQDTDLNGDAQRIEQLAWMLFLKIFSDKDKELEVLKDDYTSPIPSALHWDAWAGDDEGITGDELQAFVDQTLFPTLKNLKVGLSDDVANQRALIVREVFEGNNNYMKSGINIRKVLNKLNEIDFNIAKDRHAFGELYETILKELQSAGKSGEFYTPRAITEFICEMINPQGWGRVEYAYYLMAKDCGIDMMESRLLEENNRAHFMTKRFDRDGNVKHHIQTWCGLEHYDYNNLYGFSYEQLFQTMRVLRLTYPEAEQMFRRMVFNVMATNYDDPTKKFSFRLKQGQSWELAPAYDVCYSYNPTNIWVSQHTLSINGKHKHIAQSDLMTIAKANNIKKAETIIRSISKVVANWNVYAKEVNVEKQLSQTIAKTHLKMH